MRRSALILLMLVGCGRIGFEELALACPEPYERLGGGCYRIVLDAVELGWRDAELVCESEGGHLVVIEDESERVALAATTSTSVLWIGASARVTPGRFVGVTPQPFYFAWLPNEPDGSGACVELERGQMDDHDCLSGNDYICEIDGIAVDPTAY